MRLRLALTGLILVETACAGPHRVEFPSSQPFPQRQQLEIWQGRKARTLHAVVQGRDSLSGVPVHRPPGCDSCRVSLPLAEIDSVRAVSVERAALATHALVLGFAALVAVAWGASEGD
jgi:hypothetical protein